MNITEQGESKKYRLNRRQVIKGFLIAIIPVLVEFTSLVKPVLVTGRFLTGPEMIMVSAKTVAALLTATGSYLFITFLSGKK